MDLFKTILIDPPWMERGGGKIKRGADRHYSLMTTEQIIETIRCCFSVYPVADSAHLYLWVTNNFLRDGFQVIDALGFRYITIITWVKDRIGLGQYFRGLTEQLLFSVRGDYLPATQKGVTAIFEAKTTHSTKPNASYAMIEGVSLEPRLELFARQSRSGWTAWGNEIDDQATSEGNCS